MPTEDQNKDAERLRRYIDREQLVSVMNNTKWSELRALMLEECPFSPRYRVKCLRVDDGWAEHWDAEWYYHLPSFQEIEWIDIDPVHRKRMGHVVPDVVVDKTAELQQLLGSRTIPYEWESGYLRIYGYRRTGA